MGPSSGRPTNKIASTTERGLIWLTSGAAASLSPRLASAAFAPPTSPRDPFSPDGLSIAANACRKRLSESAGSAVSVAESCEQPGELGDENWRDSPGCCLGYCGSDMAAKISTFRRISARPNGSRPPQATAPHWRRRLCRQLGRPRAGRWPRLSRSPRRIPPRSNGPASKMGLPRIVSSRSCVLPNVASSRGPASFASAGRGVW